MFVESAQQRPDDDGMEDACLPEGTEFLCTHVCCSNLICVLLSPPHTPPPQAMVIGVVLVKWWLWSLSFVCGEHRVTGYFSSLRLR